MREAKREDSLAYRSPVNVFMTFLYMGWCVRTFYFNDLAKLWVLLQKRGKCKLAPHEFSDLTRNYLTKNKTSSNSQKRHSLRE